MIVQLIATLDPQLIVFSEVRRNAPGPVKHVSIAAPSRGHLTNKETGDPFSEYNMFPHRRPPDASQLRRRDNSGTFGRIRMRRIGEDSHQEGINYARRQRL